MKSSVINQAFVTLAMHAKIHYSLDEIDTHYRRMLEKIERKEILAFDDNKRYSELEKLKKELVSIRFMEKEE